MCLSDTEKDFQTQMRLDNPSLVIHKLISYTDFVLERL